MKPVRFFTQAEATAVVASLQPRVRRLREAYERLVQCGQNLEDIAIVYGDDAKSPLSPAHEEWRHYSDEFAGLSGRIEALVQEIQSHGPQVKDPGIGLLDFYAKRGDEVVFLCWRLGEEKVENWHSLEEGFLGRKPVETVDLR